MTVEKAHRALSLDDVDRANDLLYQARGIADLLVTAGGRPDELDGNSVVAGGWLIRDMVWEIKAIIDGTPTSGAGRDEEAEEETIGS